MSRSRKKTKIFGNAGGSDKPGKQLANRKLRKHSKAQLKKGDFDKPMPHKNEVDNVWNFPKDGKNYWKNAQEEDMRK